jgi:hypothetical protein
VGCLRFGVRDDQGVGGTPRVRVPPGDGRGGSQATEQLGGDEAGDRAARPSVTAGFAKEVLLVHQYAAPM